MELIQEIKNDIMLLKNIGNISKEVELVLLRKLTSLEKQLTIGAVSVSLLSDNRWNFVQKFKESNEFKRLTNELDIEEDRVIITAGKIYDYLTSNER